MSNLSDRAILLWHGGHCELPSDVAVCPECGGALYVYCNAWVEETGQPIADELQIECDGDETDFGDGIRHRWWQSDWQAIRDHIRQWAGALES